MASEQPCVDDIEFEFDKGWWFTALSLCGLFILFVLYDFIINKSRTTPSNLMLGRMIFNFSTALIFLLSVRSELNVCTEAISCNILGALFTICLLSSASYYTVICFDLYFTLKNPFRRPVSNSFIIHFVVIFTAAIITIPIAMAKAFEYRQDFQFCWTEYTPGPNFWNLFVVYVPAAGVVFGGVAVSYWSLKKLQAKILDDTFELRWKIIKRQTGIVGCYTLNYVLQGTIWLLCFMEHKETPTRKPPQPYLFSVFVVCAVFFDLIAWCAKDSILYCWKSNSISSSTSEHEHFDFSESVCNDNLIDIKLQIPPYQSSQEDMFKPKSNRPVTARTQLLERQYSKKQIKEFKKSKMQKQKMSQTQNLSNALRREVITFITAGLVTGVKVTAWETNKWRIHSKDSWDDAFDSMDNGNNANNSNHTAPQRSFTYNEHYRDDTDTHPALQFFPTAAPRSNTIDQSSPSVKTKHYAKSNSYAGFILDNTHHWNQKKSTDHGLNGLKKSTDSNASEILQRRGSSYQYSAQLGRHSTVAVSIPIGIGITTNHRKTTFSKKKSTLISIASSEENDAGNDSSSSNSTPSVSEDVHSSLTSTDNVPNINRSDIELEETLNAEADADDYTLEFNVGNVNDEEDIYSESLLACEEAEPSIAHFPQSINSKDTNRGTTNRFKIGVAGSDPVYFYDFAPHIFRYLRTKIYNVSDKYYLESILPRTVGGEIKRVSEEIIANFSEGRSGAFFFFTPNNKYLIKTLTKSEAKLLIDTLPDYVDFMKKNGRNTYLTKYFGLHCVALYSKVIYFMVSANVFPPNADLIRERYDIKGSWIDRHTKRHLFENKLMKDEDLHRTLKLDAMTSSNIHMQLVKDTLFLQQQNIMDYSLLLGVSYQQINVNRYGKNGDKEESYAVSANIVEGPGIYHIGIIDMLQKWNSSKKAERFLKTYIRCKNKAGISCVEPVFYRKRFLKKMNEIGIKM